MRVVEIPQWQGSASPAAGLLSEGARRLADLFPAGQRVRSEVEEGPGTRQEGVRHFDVLTRNLAAIRDAVAADSHEPVTVTVGGDCGVELAPVDAAHQRYGERLAVVWYDAHGDLNTPASSPSGAFHGMVLRSLLGEGPAALSPRRPLSPRQVVLAGVRALDSGEQDFIEGNRIPRIPADEAVADVVAATGADAVYVHIDLDVLDPETFGSMGYPEPGGVTPERLAASVAALTERFTLAGLGITEYQPSAEKDHQVLSGLVQALSAAMTAGTAAEDGTGGPQGQRST